MRTTRARYALAALVILAASFAAACAEAPPPQAPGGTTATGAYPKQAGYPAPPPQATAAATATAPTDVLQMGATPPRSVPDAVSRLDQAEQILGALLGDSSGRTPVQRPAPIANGVAQGTADPCQIACLALASMKRSAEHVCTMAGDADPACGSARSRVERAQERVLASCPACAEAHNPNKSG